MQKGQRDSAGTWKQAGDQHARAARQLSEAGLERPSVSRAYYAAYSWITHEIVNSGFDSFGRHKNPDHHDLPNLILNTLSSVHFSDRRSLATIVRRLRAHREDADYRPSRVVNRGVRLACLRLLISVERLLGHGGAR